ncbi:phosphoribosylaminoimidazole carboxylase ADE2 [Ascoidea rubescens DSM 1968]|uniref:Phosphoribosylaminoimidazole carboxylase n=1 Tax=Ascoidea rubescens DSM 1968 TaxID=1344418 RepID=A0A1D2VNG4_9ASCO|nr:Phosphoribosylaminoimidazole carboxylase [Ascoidea rubescens DSM 1968]ODV63136.1 Phosphoribosylaminoimidazole carboxylase [Ascoidea rubescens DSM 1968]
MDDKVLGILGGGQLGRMVLEVANRLNIKTYILDSGINTSAKQISNSTEHIDGSFKDAESIKKLCEKSDVITIEIEHINADILIDIQKSKPSLKIFPSPKIIKLIQDKYIQKIHFIHNDINVAESASVEKSEESLIKIGGKFGYPFMLKSRTLAYDGRGNFVVNSKEDVPKGLEFLKNNNLLYAEKWCPFIKELAVMVVLTQDGSVHTYPTVETIHKNNICHIVYAPAEVSSKIQVAAQELAKKAVGSLKEAGAGIFGVEMFLLEDGELLINEIAPRPHNSGHYTIDACVCSQFEAHIRAVMGLPIPEGATSFSTNTTNAIMLNVIGFKEPNGELKACHRAFETAGASVYLYGKSSRHERKVGHINIVGSSMEENKKKLDYIMSGVSSKVPSSIAGTSKTPLIGVVMGSDSDLPVMAVGANILKKFNIPFELSIVSAHRTPLRMVEYAKGAGDRGLKVIIAGAGGAAHLPGMVAAMTTLPVIGVPVKGSSLDGVDSLYSIVQMPRGIPVATVAINNSTNAALLAIRILSSFIPEYREQMERYMAEMEKEVNGKIERIESIGYEAYLK